MQLTNTLTRKKENFKPRKEEKVKVYYCGPTPYNYAHIGNLRTYLFNDVAVRTLRFLGYKVVTAMNITDIDDKTIKRSQEIWVSLKEFTTKYTDIFFEDLEKLKIQKADSWSPISELIPEMVQIINWLLKKWYAYIGDDWSVYYSISKFIKYGEFAHLDFKWMKTSVRINNDEYEKEQAADFALWKAYDEKDWPNKWEAKFVVDWVEKIIWWRPGWHIECSACNLKFLGEQIDLHMWAIDLIFPHHQNEIAQTEAFTWKEFSKYWIHAWHVLVDNIKMSKSLWNFYTLHDLEESTNNEISNEKLYRSFRLMNLQSKYSESFNFTYVKLNQAVETLKSFDEVFKRIKNYKKQEWKVRKDVSENLQFFVQNYIASLEDDFSTVEALVSVFDLVKYVNSWIDKDIFNSSEIEGFIGVFKTFNEVLNIFDFELLETSEEIPQNIIDLFNLRNKAKLEKWFKLADELRDEILELWYKIVDDKNWSRVEKV